MCKDFPETNNILKIVADFSASVKKVSKLLGSNMYRSSVIILQCIAVKIKMLKFKNDWFVFFGHNAFQSNLLKAIWYGTVEFLKSWLWQVLSDFCKLEAYVPFR